MRRALILGALLGSFGTTLPRVAMAQAPESGPSVADRAEARRNFQAGVAAYARREFAAALTSFQTAYRLAPHPTVRVNMANCYVELQRPAEALEHFEQFLAESPAVTPAQRQVLTRQMRALERQVAQVRLAVSPGDVMGLAVTIDGQTVSTVRPARVSAGHHVVEAFADGFATTRREIDVVAATPMDLALVLERPTAAPVATPVVTATAPVAPTPVVAVPAPTPVVAVLAPTPVVAVPAPTPVVAAPDAVTAAPAAEPLVVAMPTPHPETPRRAVSGRMRPAAFFAVAGVTVATGVVWGVSGAMALAARSDYDAAQARLLAGGDRAANLLARQDAQSSMSTLAVISDVAMGVTLAGLATSVILALRTDFRAPAVEVSAAPLANGGAVALTGRF